jgi:hypothetical protein
VPTPACRHALSRIIFAASLGLWAALAPAAGTGAATRGVVAFSGSHLRGPLALRFAPNGYAVIDDVTNNLSVYGLPRN